MAMQWVRVRALQAEIRKIQKIIEVHGFKGSRDMDKSGENIKNEEKV